MDINEATQLAFKPITDDMRQEEINEVTLAKDYINRFYTTFGELNNREKQNNRIEALKHSIISDIEKILGDDEIKLPHREWYKEIKFFNQDSETISLIKKVSKEFVLIETEGKKSQYLLSNIDTDSLIKVLGYLETYALEKYLNYPDCCVEFFFRGNRSGSEKSWEGFIPCLKHKDLSLEEIIELLGRDPTREEHFYNLQRTPEPEAILSEKYKNFIVEVDDNYDGTFSGYCYTVDEEGDIEYNLTPGSPRHFSQQEALNWAKEFADNYKE